MTLDNCIIEGKKAEIQLFQKVKQARTMYLESGVQKSGFNRFHKFKYYTLDDIVPVADGICNELGLLTLTDVTNNTATMQVVDIETGRSIDFKFSIQLTDDCPDNINQQIQNLGKTITYARRYLYMLFLDIVEPDAVDCAKQTKTSKTTTPKNTKPVQEVQKTKPDDIPKLSKQEIYDQISPELERKVSIQMNNELQNKKLNPSEPKNRRLILDMWKEEGLLESREYPAYEIMLGLTPIVGGS
ncbi:ERF family protein [Methanosphaera cuniculi]|uniref:ERF superfamily protein n=1 Tax=Methanosphaera cuniculi TaxID=1077256 RepID=A0A2A2HDR5_9EURY|nr:ERF family protein [Methanosphaera cuniculi]PAV07537.1 hypothetical protein ASJ82_07625 [Methanosphaera cuniculi]PWL08147.1 ERF superfamily protein [Methanosphaera cuniculi]